MSAGAANAKAVKLRKEKMAWESCMMAMSVRRRLYYDFVAVGRGFGKTMDTVVEHWNVKCHVTMAVYTRDDGGCIPYFIL